MAIVTISRGSYSKGVEVAEGVAEKLGHDCISRDVLLAASDQFNIPEIKLEHAIHDAPSILDRFTHGKTAYMAYIQSALLERVRKGDVVYHGLAGHLLLKEIRPVLKVRIIADMGLRIGVVRKREGVDEQEARRMIQHLDEERRRWTRRLYGVDPADEALYDLVICIDKIEVRGAVDLICQAASQPVFKLTSGERQRLADLALACAVRSELLELDPNVIVTCEYGNVRVITRSGDRRVRKLDDRAALLTTKLSGVNHIEVQVEETKRSREF